MPIGLSRWNPYAATEDAYTNLLTPTSAAARKSVQGSLDVDRPRRLPAAAQDQEGQVNDHLGPIERGPQRVGVANVTAAVLHLRPATLRRIERPPSDADDAIDPIVLLEQGHQ